MLIGIDLGTTALKVAAYDTKRGTLLHGVEKRLAVDTGGDGRREQEPDAVVRALRQTLREVGKALGGLARVSGVALAAQGGSTIIADREGGEAYTPMILWNDGRAFARFREIAEGHPTRYWRSRTLRDEPGMGLARIAWLRSRQPELFCGGTIYTGAGEYVFHALTGFWRQDACNAMQSGVFDTRTGTLSHELAGLAGVTPDFFAPVRQGHERHGVSKRGAALFGLPEGVPVAGPYMDHEAGYLSVAQVSERPLQCSLGTAWVGNFRLPEGLSGASPFQFAIPSPAGAGQLVIQPLLTGNVTWDWALQSFVDGNNKRAIAKLQPIFEERILPHEGLVALPWLNRPNVWRPENLGAASFLGLGPQTTGEELVRAVASGMCFELARVFAAVLESGAADSVVLSGGASQGVQFQQLVSALFGSVPVYQVEESAWMGTRGALHAFGARVSRARVRRIRPSGAIDRGALERARGDYLDAFGRMYSHVAAGHAYAVEKRNSP